MEHESGLSQIKQFLRSSSVMLQSLMQRDLGQDTSNLCYVIFLVTNLFCFVFVLPDRSLKSAPLYISYSWFMNNLYRNFFCLSSRDNTFGFEQSVCYFYQVMQTENPGIVWDVIQFQYRLVTNKLFKLGCYPITNPIDTASGRIS